MSFEAYSVAIRLKLLDGVSAGLVGLATQFGILNRHIGTSQEGLLKIEGQLQRLKTMGLLGAGALAVGAGGLELLSAPLKAAREYELAFTKFKTLNLGESVNQQADKFARSANLMGVSAKELMQTMAESVGLFGSYSAAQQRAPQLAALNVANSAIFHGKIDAIDEGGTRSLMKFIDRRGGTKDKASFDAGLNLAEKMVTGSGGFVQFRDLASFSQQGGTAFRSLSDQGVMNLALLLQEQGGSRAGTALMSIYQNLVAGRTPVKTMHLLEEMGLGSIHQRVSGSVGRKRSTSNIFELNPAYSAVLQSDPTEFFRSIFLPQLAKHGITDEAGILKATNDLLSNRTASNQASIMTTQLMQIARDANLTKGAMGVSQVTDAFAKDPNARWVDLNKKYTNLMVELGEAALPIVTKAIHGLTAIVQGLTHFAREFPATTKLIITAFAGLAALAVVGGAFTLIGAGLKAISLAVTLGSGGLGAQLLTVAGGLGAVASRLGKLGVLGLTGAAAYEGTRFVADTGIPWALNALGAAGAAQKFQNWTFGGQLYDWTHSDSPHIGGGRTGQSPVFQLNADAQKMGITVAPAVAGQLSKALQRPQTGISGFDSVSSPIPAGGH